MNLAEYVVTDSFFGTPYVDTEEFRDEPVPFHYVHGGFEGTGTRFSFYFPAKDVVSIRKCTGAGSSNMCIQVTTNGRADSTHGGNPVGTWPGEPAELTSRPRP